MERALLCVEPSSPDLDDPGRAALRGIASSWGFAIDRASHDDYEDNFLPTGSPSDGAEVALDCAGGLYISEPIA